METRRKYQASQGLGSRAKNTGLLALIVLSVATDMAFQRYRVKEEPVVWEYYEVLPDCCPPVYYDSRGVPYYYETQYQKDGVDSIFYYDTPIKMPVDKKNHQ